MEKLKISLKYWLLGRNYINAIKAMEFAQIFHIGKRKNGDPEFIHQLTIVQFLRTFDKQIPNMEDVLCAGFLHDTSEDYDIGFEELEANFGKSITNAVKLLTKKFRGNRIQDEVYYANIGTNLIASFVKGADRIHNIQSMIGVFTLEKQKAYIEETEKLTLPMLKQARKNFPEFESVFENIKLILKSQITLIKEIHNHV